MTKSNPQNKTEDDRKPSLPQVIAILGPTCSGKSSIAVNIAERLGGQIISCDSMQIYKGMDIGTATPPPEVLKKITHHLVNELDIHQRYDAHKFVTKAKIILPQIACQHPNTPVVLVGGTGLYAKALIYGYDMQPSDRRVYQQVESEYAGGAGEKPLRKELLRAFPDISRSKLINPRRLMRSVEILRLNGDPRTGGQNKAARQVLPGWQQYVVMPPPNEWHRDLERRTRNMLENGWIEETAELVADGLLQTPTAHQALGYREIAAYLEGKITSKNDLYRQVLRKTRQYARRQRTWFRHQHPGAYVLSLRPGLPSTDIATAIITEYLSQTL